MVELQKATHFDKKELQQWYKGDRLRSSLASLVPVEAWIADPPERARARTPYTHRFPQGVSVGYPAQG